MINEGETIEVKCQFCGRSIILLRGTERNQRQRAGGLTDAARGRIGRWSARAGLTTRCEVKMTELR